MAVQVQDRTASKVKESVEEAMHRLAGEAARAGITLFHTVTGCWFATSQTDLDPFWGRATPPVRPSDAPGRTKGAARMSHKPSPDPASANGAPPSPAPDPAELGRAAAELVEASQGRAARDRFLGQIVAVIEADERERAFARLDVPDDARGPLHLFRFTVAGDVPDPGYVCLEEPSNLAGVVWNGDPVWFPWPCRPPWIDCAEAAVLAAIAGEVAP